MDFGKGKYLLLILISSYSIAFGQGKPIGTWNSLLSYNTGYGVATDGITLYSISKGSFFTYNTHTASIQTYSKVNGMSDIGMQCIAYDLATSTAILVYSNGNIDLFKDNIFTNIPDFKLKTVASSKAVNDIYTENGKAYLSSSLGIIVIDLVKESFEETYQFYDGTQLLQINGFTSDSTYFYTVTQNGLYKAPKNSIQLQNFGIWQKLDSHNNLLALKALNNRIYVCDTSSVYVLQNDTLRSIFTTTDLPIKNISLGHKSLYVGEYRPYQSKIFALDSNFNAVDSIHYSDQVSQVTDLLDGSVWISNAYSGLFKKSDSINLAYYGPDCPADATSVDIYAHNGSFLIAHGGYNDNYLNLNNGNGFTTYIPYSWHHYKKYSYPPFADSLSDFVTITRDESDGTIYAGSFWGGLFELHTDGTYKIYKQGSSLDPSGQNGANAYQVIGTAIDQNSNLWVTMFGSYHELNVKEHSTGNWYKFHIPYSRSYENAGGPMVFDDANNVWYASAFGGGVVGYNTNNTLSDESDDVSYHLATGVGYGNLPSNTVKCIAHDKSDNLWIGTDNGIGILYNASSCLSQNQHCDAEIPIVQYDKYAGYLFANQVVNTIAVDGANRKWVGTDNGGVWLLSPDAGNSSIINKFTKDNSPLPSDRILKITVDDVTGDVYIGTDAGLITYRGSATDGGTTNQNVLTFPNPVPSNYKGTIAIKGLVTNADVRITDVNGQLVYRTTALGGQAVWNGLDYKGHKPQSGVYLIFATNSDGSQTYAGKMVFLQ